MTKWRLWLKKRQYWGTKLNVHTETLKNGYLVLAFIVLPSTFFPLPMKCTPLVAEFSDSYAIVSGPRSYLRIRPVHRTAALAAVLLSRCLLHENSALSAVGRYTTSHFMPSVCQQESALRPPILFKRWLFYGYCRVTNINNHRASAANH